MSSKTSERPTPSRGRAWPVLLTALWLAHPATIEAQDAQEAPPAEAPAAEAAPEQAEQAPAAEAAPAEQAAPAQEAAAVAPAAEAAAAPVAEKEAALPAPSATELETGLPAAQLPPPSEEAGSIAQDAPPAAKDEVIMVTGSRIGRDNLEDFGRVDVVTSQDIEMSGISTVDELLRRLPSVTLQGINKNNNNGGNGLAFIDLRNLGTGRTLVLVNGRRFVTNGTGVSEAVDLNNIPVPMIERIEVLLDGASAIYGSDAIGGVVNIILKKNFEGARAEVYAGITDDGDGEEIGVTGTVGTNFGSGNITLNVSYMRREPIKQRDRDWAAEPRVFAAFNNGQNADDGVLEILGSSAVPEGRVGGSFFRPDPATGASFQPFAAPDLSQRYNYGDRQWLIGNQERVSVTALANYELTMNTNAFVEATYTHRESRQRLAPQPLGLSGTTTFPNGFQVPVTNPYLPADFAATLAPGTPSVLVARRMVQVGDRITDVNADTMRVVAGLDGRIGDRLNWEAYVNYGANRSTQSVSNSVDLARALETADPELCAANASKGCVVGDWFGAGSLQDEVVDYIRYTDTESTGYTQFSGGATISGELADLWAGPLGGAAGTVYRQESGFNRPSARTIAGDASGNGLDPTKGDYNVFEFFGELSLPLVRNVPGIKDLTLDGAARWSRFNTFGSDTTFRGALSYSPTSDIRLRGVYSTAFRAPGISDLFGGSADSFETLTDPCNDWDTSGTIDPQVKENCMAAGVPAGFNQNISGGSQIRTNIGGNPDLAAETATVIDLGVVLTPQFLKPLQGFNATVDYYIINVDNAITNPEPQWLLDDCYGSPGLSSGSCGALDRGLNGGISRLDANALNIGKVQTRGVDVTIGYGVGLKSLGLPDWGRVDLSWKGNYLLDYQETINGQTVRYEGTITSNKGTFAHWRHNIGASFSTEHWTFMHRTRYIGGAEVFGVTPGTDPNDWVEPVTYWDLSLQYRLKGLSVIAGVDNVLDTDPPFFLEGGQNASPASYDFSGRFFYTRLAYQI